jgi:hypothetical protein
MPQYPQIMTNERAATFYGIVVVDDVATAPPVSKTLRKIIPPNAKLRYNVVIGTPVSPTGGEITQMPAPQRMFNMEKKETDYSQSTTITRNPDYEEPEEQSQKNGDLF